MQDRFVKTFGIALLCAVAASGWPAQSAGQENEIQSTIGTLRRLPDAERARTTKRLALQIRKLSAGTNKVNLAVGLSSLATEGDFGRDTLQDVTTTLAVALRESPQGSTGGEPFYGYSVLAQLHKYEGMRVDLDAPELKLAVRQLDALDAKRATVDFTLTDLKGKKWTRSALKGKVVLVNFWATWCPPCRKEMPDLNDLYKKFSPKGFVILAISAEPKATVEKFIASHGYSYPILLDLATKVNTDYGITGIPKSFLYDRKGNMIAQTIDMRTRGQFLALLAKAGLR